MELVVGAAGGGPKTWQSAEPADTAEYRWAAMGPDVRGIALAEMHSRPDLLRTDWGILSAARTAPRTQGDAAHAHRYLRRQKRVREDSTAAAAPRYPAMIGGARPASVEWVRREPRGKGRLDTATVRSSPRQRPEHRRPSRSTAAPCWVASRPPRPGQYRPTGAPGRVVAAREVFRAEIRVRDLASSPDSRPNFLRAAGL